SPSTFANAAAGSSCTKAAVFLRNIGIFGTPSTAITAAARSLASSAVSGKVPVAAYTSIIGMGRRHRIHQSVAGRADPERVRSRLRDRRRHSERPVRDGSGCGEKGLRGLDRGPHGTA